MSTEQTTESFDESVLEALRGHDRRYDVAIDGELVLAVQPNGVKTWTWVYDKETVPQRKTLGIYPDMSIEDAKKSLAAERAAHGDASPGPEFVIRDGRIETAAPAASQIPVLAGAAVAMITVAALAWLFLNDDPDSPRNPPAAQLTMDKSIGSAADNGSSPFRDTSTASDAGSIQLPQAQSIEDAGQPEVSQTAATAPVSPALPDVRAATPVDPDPVPDDRQAIGEELRRLVTAESNDPLAKIAVRRSASPTVAAPTESVATQPAPKQAAPKQAAPKQAAPTQAAPTQAALAQQASTQAAPTQSVPTQVAPPVTAVAPPAETAAPVFNEGEVPNGLLVDSRVARGRLTSAVEQREPVDDLGSTIMGSGAAEQQYYFFTELRELAGQRVRHRWIYNDRVVAEVPFNVGEAWRWRVYSSKTFLPSMTGRWHVQVVLEDNSIIYSLPFTFIQ